MSLTVYRRKRRFGRTPEPRGRARSRRTGARRRGELRYVIHEHDATRLHHDLRLEHRGVLLSWAVPKGPPLVPGEKVLAVRTEDHPMEYGDFEGVIPAGEYGAGTVMVWDHGRWEPSGDPERGLAEGKLTFALSGTKLHGRWSLVRTRPQPHGGARAGNGRGGKEQWLLIKRTDPGRSSAASAAQRHRSASTGRTMAEIAADADRTWSSTRGEVGQGRRFVDPPSADPIRELCAQLPGARTSAMPERLSPQLATPAATAPEGDEWIHEIKLDGYRVLAFKDGATVTLRSRSGRDWTRAFRTVAERVAALPVASAVLDGELVVLRPDGRSDFQALQNALDGQGNASVAYFAFDLPWCAGYELTGVPLLARKEVLARLLAVAGASQRVRFGDHVQGRGPHVFAEACRLGLEGVISKRADSRYAQRRTRSWLKVKCAIARELVIGGWTDPSGARSHFGSLLLGEPDSKGGLVYRGRVGTGFDERTLASLREALAPLETRESPFVNPPGGARRRGVHWVVPELGARVSFTELTREGLVRQATFRGLVRRASASRAGVAPGPVSDERAGAAQGVHVAGVRITHPDRVLYPAQHITKAEVARYCAEVAPHFLPHVVGRPLTLMRCPEGTARACFYQKHARPGLPRAIRSVRVAEKGDSGLYVWVDDVEGLVSLVQFGVLEIHPWGSRVDRLERPDRLVLDLDPDPSVPWKEVVATARALHAVLEGLRLASFLRTTGGKGLHVVVPIERRSTWTEAKRFCHDLVLLFAREAPERYVLTMSKAARKGRIFLDYLRNDRGSTAIASYCMRARDGAPVATPLRWEELSEDLDPAAFTMASVPARLAQGGDPWAGFADVRQALTRAIQAAVRPRASPTYS